MRIFIFLIIGIFVSLRAFASFSTSTIDNLGGDQNGTYLFGNLGIGTSLPGQSIDVQGTIRSTGFINSSGTTGAMICLTAGHQLGHCTGSASCTSTCTCTCANN